ncbi:MAG TPA: hypothetical protein VEQ60_21260 [Longimicrobium sp.]|nr:hypothetical protein [Longimicrobium sp.]
MRTIFDAGSQRWKIWFVVLICLLCGGGLLFPGGYLLLNYGLHPDDGGVLKPLMSRILMGAVFVVPGMAIIAAILLYLRCYVMRIEADDVEEGAYRIALAAPGQALTIGHDDIARAGYNEGISHAGGISVNAPWYSLRLCGRRFPLIIDLHGDFLDRRAVDRLIEGKMPSAVVPPRRKPQGKKRLR